MEHTAMMLGKDEIVAALKRRVDERAITQKAIADALGLPPPRVTELFKGERDLSADEAKILVERFHIADPVTFSLGALSSILTGMLAGLVCDRVLQQEVPVLAGALQYMLRRISENPVLSENPALLEEASRSAVSRPDPASR